MRPIIFKSDPVVVSGVNWQMSGMCECGFCTSNACASLWYACQNFSLMMTFAIGPTMLISNGNTKFKLVYST